MCALRTAQLLGVPFVYQRIRHMSLREECHPAKSSASLTAECMPSIQQLERIFRFDQFAAWSLQAPNETLHSHELRKRIDAWMAWDPRDGGDATQPCRPNKARPFESFKLPAETLFSRALLNKSQRHQLMRAGIRLPDSNGRDPHSKHTVCTGNHSVGGIIARCAGEMPLTAYEELMPALRAVYRENAPPAKTMPAFTIALHVRRGDVGSGRGIRIVYFQELAKRIAGRHTNAHLSSSAPDDGTRSTFGMRYHTRVLPVRIDLYSEGTNASAWYDEFAWCTTNVSCTLHLSTPLEATIRDMIAADVFVADTSSLSTLAALYNENEVHFPPRWTHEPALRRWNVDTDLLVAYLTPGRDFDKSLLDPLKFATGSIASKPHGDPITNVSESPGNTRSRIGIRDRVLPRDSEHD
uniref:Uncharacterized protein n=1 Tax=Haptolina brevifila TaxID=156173 RepID=A0A7S2IZT8_9EUKA